MAQITIIEFTDTQVRVVAGDRSAKGRVTVRLATSVAVERLDDAAARTEARVAALKALAKQHKLTGAQAHVIVPKNFVMARMATLPSAVPEELDGMARFEAERHIPFNADRHIVSHHTMAINAEQGTSNVLLAAVDGPVAQEHVETVSRAGFGVAGLHVSTLALFNAMKRSAPEPFGKVVALIINIGAGSMDFVIANREVLALTRGASISLLKLTEELNAVEGGRHFELGDLKDIDAMQPGRAFGLNPLAAGQGLHVEMNDPESSGIMMSSVAEPEAPADPDHALPGTKQKFVFDKWLTSMLRDAKRTYDFARREGNLGPVECVFLTGEGAVMTNLAGAVSAALGVGAQVFDPLADLNTNGKNSANIQAPTTAYAAAVGALAPPETGAISLNLIPPKYTAQERKKRARQNWVFTGIFAAVALVLGFIYINDNFAAQEERLRYYKRQNQQMREPVAELNTKVSKLRIIERYVSERQGALDILEALSGNPLIPERAVLTRFEYTRDESAKFQGHARSINDTNRLRGVIEGLGFFSEVKIDEQGPFVLPSRVDEVQRFTITATFPKKKTGSSSGSGSGTRVTTEGSK